MAYEIERKFLLRKMPDLSGIEPIEYERYYIYLDDKIELRVQHRGSKYEIERKNIIDKLKADKSKLEISKEEFNKLKTLGKKVIKRTGYNITQNPDVSVKVYHGDHEGLIRIEVEFSNKKQATEFQIPDWFGKEISSSIVSRDSKLINMSKERLKKFLEANSQ